MTQIPAARVPVVTIQNGGMTREWYRFFSETLSLSSGKAFSTLIDLVTQDVLVDNSVQYILAQGDVTITLLAGVKRDSILTITNIGTGTVTVVPSAGETISGKSSLEIAYQYSSAQLLPISTRGYVII